MAVQAQAQLDSQAPAVRTLPGNHDSSLLFHNPAGQFLAPVSLLFSTLDFNVENRELEDCCVSLLEVSFPP